MNVFINLPIADIARSRGFFSALGFTFNDHFSDDTALAMAIGGNCFSMLLTRETFGNFAPHPVADPAKTSQVLLALQLDSRAEVDAMMATACAHGGKEVRPAQDHGFMYGRAFADPDGHIWEPFWMNPAAIPGDDSD